MCVSLIIAMQISYLILHNDFMRAIVVAGVLHSVWSELALQGNILEYYS